MPSPGDDLHDAGRWMSYARANLLHAEAGRAAGVVIEYLCFDAQQAAEKALKAVLIVRRADVPRTHDIERLLAGLRQVGVVVPDPVSEAERLTAFAVQARYPASDDPLDDSDLTNALSLARAVVDWAAQIIEASPPAE